MGAGVRAREVGDGDYEQKRKVSGPDCYHGSQRLHLGAVRPVLTATEVHASQTPRPAPLYLAAPCCSQHPVWHPQRPPHPRTHAHFLNTHECNPPPPRPPPPHTHTPALHSGAEAKACCTEAGMFALRERRVHVTQEDFEMAVAKVGGEGDVWGVWGGGGM